MSIEVLGRLRHRCLQCGGICHSAVPVGAEEADQIATRARTVGVSRPVVDGRLRTVQGRCVFLAKDRRCKLHTRFGPEAKPKVCQQYPVVSTRTETHVRVGVDPGCLMAYQSWRDGPEVDTDRLLTSRVELPEAQRDSEQQLLDACGLEGQTLGGLLQILTGEPADAGPPAAFGQRLLARVQGSKLAARIQHPDTLLPLRDLLTPIARRISGLEAPPEWSLGADEEAYAIASIQRMLFLRLVHFFPMPVGTALVLTSGAVLCAWTHTEADRFGPALSAWCRIVRTPEVVAELVPDPAALAALLGRP